ncbi:ferritin-like domain-containing protein [Sediminicola sp. 1XM1-17]|uniref:ferritin-like domain-containing protein n=1 Tax=Sediminicola sp. 1XM1-17 TaxID=3127702 RepID=UPI003076C7AD
MNTKSKALVDQLSEILQKNKDAEKGYAKAAENAKSLGLKNYFKRKSDERSDFNNQLKSAIAANFNEVDDSGSFTGSMHRTWMDIKTFFSGNEDEAMMEEAIRGEKAAVEEYKEVLEDQVLPLPIEVLIREQKLRIEKDLSTIKSLEDLE